MAKDPSVISSGKLRGTVAGMGRFEFLQLSQREFGDGYNLPVVAFGELFVVARALPPTVLTDAERKAWEAIAKVHA